MTDIRGYYDQSYPPSLWETPVVPATGATAGVPGTWTPAGSTPPATVADLIAGTPNAVVASPLTAWTIGQYVQTATIGTGGRAYWNGTAWVAGASPVLDVANLTIADIQDWVDSNPDLADEVLSLERQRGSSARTTLLDWLEGFIAHRDDDSIADDPPQEGTES